MSNNDSNNEYLTVTTIIVSGHGSFKDIQSALRQFKKGSAQKEIEDYMNKKLKRFGLIASDINTESKLSKV